MIRKTPKELHEQRARLIASTGLSEKVLRERGEAFQLYPEHQAVWDTVHGIDYLLDGAEPPENGPCTADTLRSNLLHALDFAQCANLGYATPEQMLDAYDAAHAAECSAPLDRAALRQQIAQALVRYDWNAGLSGRDTPSAHHYGEADAVMAVLVADEAKAEGDR
uniref:PCQ3_105 n=1 Tax=Streptomyces sp. W9 TaxID=682410 RepID=D0UZF4_9ACTN|nr:pCQ3_105 [Streptomyces sp. W9]